MSPKPFSDYDFISLSKSAPHPRERMRFLAFSHLQENKTPGEVADIVRVSKNTVYRWLRAFHKYGLEGLKEKPGRGKKPLISDIERAAFRQAVLDLQNSRPGGCINGNDVLRLMKEKYGITCSVKSAYNHLKRASLVWISARSKHPKSDHEKQEEFKKNSKKKCLGYSQMESP